MRLRRLCLLILVFRFFLRDPISKISVFSPLSELARNLAGRDHRSSNDFIQGVFDDSFRTELFQLGDHLTSLPFREHHFEGHPTILSQS